MTKRTWMYLTAVLLVFGLVAVACGDDEDEAPAPSAAAPADEAPADDAPAADDDAPADDAPADDTDDAPAPTTTAVPVVAGELAGVCPSPLVVQTDWFPESEHGAMYELVGEGYSVDQNNGVVRGPMVLGRHGSGHRVGGPRGRSVPWGVVGV